MYTVSLPLYIAINHKIKFGINLNHYRNAHYFTLNKAKVMFKQAILKQLEEIPVLKTPVRLTYTYHPGSKRKMDIANVLSIADKFFSDCLVETGKIPDDDYNHINEVSFKAGTQKSKATIMVSIAEE